MDENIPNCLGYFNVHFKFKISLRIVSNIRPAYKKHQDVPKKLVICYVNTGYPREAVI